jgi:hypothetical protein
MPFKLIRFQIRLDSRSVLPCDIENTFTNLPLLSKNWGFRVRDYEECRLVESDAVRILWEPTFRTTL